MQHRFSALATACTALIGCQTAPNQDVTYEADIRLSPHGIPHIKSGTFAGAGYGAGYAYAGDNLCLTAEHAVTLRGERARYFGKDNSYQIPFILFNSDPKKPNNVNNLESDIYFHYYYTPERIKAVEQGLSQDTHDLLKGFAAGFNRRIAEHRKNGDGPACVSEPWMSRLTMDDMLRRTLNVTILESGDLFRSAIPFAKPPSQTKSADALGGTIQLAADLSRIRQGGSNAYAFGRDATGKSGSLVFGNPHFPWQGTERQYALQLTVGEDYNVFGSTLTGLPVPLLGFNQDMAWSITYSTDTRTAIYALELDPSDPTRYRLDDAFVPMVQSVVKVPLSDDDVHESTVYTTRFGPVFAGGPFAWTQQSAYAISDFSVGNDRMLDTYLNVGRASTVEEVRTVLSEQLGLQFSNLVAGDSKGDVLYSNYSVAANFSDEKIATCLAGESGRGLFDSYGLAVLRGETACLHDTAPDAIQPDAIPASKRPSIIRQDYVTNTNDSHWIVNADPASYLGGFQRTIGQENSIRGERTRLSIAQAEDRMAGRDGYPGTAMTSEILLDIFYAGRNRTAELITDDLVSGCRENPAFADESGASVDLTAACDVLAKWDRTNSVDSKGAVLFETLMANLPRPLNVDYRFNPALWRVPFDPENPIETPSGIIVGKPVLQALAKSVTQLTSLGIALDTRYGDVHGGMVGDTFYALPGGRFLFHAIRPLPNGSAGYTGPIVYGNSFIQLVDVTPEGPKTKFVMAYSQGTDPDSAHLNDQFPLYANNEWLDLPFSEAEITAAPGYKTLRISE